MISEKQKQFRKRRFEAGFNNAKKDAWARRSKPMPMSIDDKLKSKISNIPKDLIYVGFWQRIWNWLKSLFGGE